MSNAGKKRKVGDIYVELGLLTPTQRDEVLFDCRKKNKKFLEAVKELGFVSEQKLKGCFGQDFEHDLVAVDPKGIPLTAQYLFSPEFMYTYGFVPLGLKKEKGGYFAHIGMLTPSDLGTIELLSQKFKYPIKPLLITALDLVDILESLYRVDFDELVKKEKKKLHPILLRQLIKGIRKPKNKLGKIHHSLNLIENAKLKKDKAPKKLNITNTQVLYTQEESEKVMGADTRERLLIPSALAYRVMPPLVQAPPKDTKETDVHIGDRRTDSRRHANMEYMIGIKIVAPSENPQGKRKRGVIRQFVIENFSRSGLFLSGNEVNDLEIGAVYEILFSTPSQRSFKSETRSHKHPIHFSLIGKVIRMELESDKGKITGIGVKIESITGEMRPLWEGLTLVNNTAA